MCNRGEYCTFEITKKLIVWGIGAKDREDIIKRLVDKRLIDDNRFADAYSKVRLHGHGWGKRKIRMGLFSKRIPSQIIEDVLANMDPHDYTQAAKDLLRRKQAIEQGDTNDHAYREKLIKYGAGRGFEPDLLLHIINHDL